MDHSGTPTELDPRAYTDGFRTFRPDQDDDDLREVWVEDEALAGIAIMQTAFAGILDRKLLSEPCRERLKRGLINIFINQADRINRRLNDLVNVRLKIRARALNGSNAEEEKTEAELKQIDHYQLRRDAFYALSSELIRADHEHNRTLLPYGNLYDPDRDKMLIIDGADHIRSIENEKNAVNYTHRIIITGGNFPDGSLVGRAVLALKVKYPDLLLSHTGETGTEQLVSRLAEKYDIRQDIVDYIDKPYASVSTLEQPDTTGPALSRPYFPDPAKRLSSVPEANTSEIRETCNPALSRVIRHLEIEGKQEEAAARYHNEQYSETYLNKVDQLFQAPAFGVVALDDSISSKCILGRAAQFGYHVWKPYLISRNKPRPPPDHAPDRER